MHITVYTWKLDTSRWGDRDLRLPTDTGHAAIALKSGGVKSYYSWWPPQNRMLGLAHYVEERYPGDKRKMARPGNMPLCPADGKYRFSFECLSVPLLRATLEQIVTGDFTTSWFATPGAFGAAVQNCSAYVAWALRKAGCERYAPWPGYMIWHPNNLAHYCEQLVRAIQALPGAHPDDASVVRAMPGASPAPDTMWLVKKTLL